MGGTRIELLSLPPQSRYCAHGTKKAESKSFRLLKRKGAALFSAEFHRRTIGDHLGGQRLHNGQFAFGRVERAENMAVKVQLEPVVDRFECRFQKGRLLQLLFQKF